MAEKTTTVRTRTTTCPVGEGAKIAAGLREIGLEQVEICGVPHGDKTRAHYKFVEPDGDVVWLEERSR